MKFTAVLISISLITTYTPAQTNEVGKDYFSTGWDFYSFNYLSTKAAGRGYTGIAQVNDISGIILNPATFEVEKKYEFHGEFSYKSRVSYSPPTYSNWPIAERYEQVQPIFFVGAGVKISKNFYTGAAYYSEKGYDFHFQEGNYEEFVKIRFDNISFPVIVNFGSIVKVGGALNIKLVSGEGNRPRPSAKTYEVVYVPQFGMLAFEGEHVKMGLTVTLPVDREIGVHNHVGDEAYEVHPFPLRIGAGISALFNQVSMELDYKYVNNSSHNYYLHDTHNFHFGGEYKKGNLTLRGGAFSSLNYDFYDSSIDEYFLTAGATYRMKNFDFDLSIIDSHLFSTGIKHTIINGGIGFSY